jgi:hypothetical protein
VSTILPTRGPGRRRYRMTVWCASKVARKMVKNEKRLGRKDNTLQGLRAGLFDERGCAWIFRDFCGRTGREGWTVRDGRGDVRLLSFEAKRGAFWSLYRRQQLQDQPGCCRQFRYGTGRSRSREGRLWGGLGRACGGPSLAWKTPRGRLGWQRVRILEELRPEAIGRLGLLQSSFESTVRKRPGATGGTKHGPVKGRTSP